MVWINPFLIKNSEQHSTEGEFLTLFNSSVLEMVKEPNFEKVSYISSTPGAGKTSLFRAFSPKILNEICKSENSEYQDFRVKLRELGVITGRKINLLSADLSCARNYSIIDEMFTNGRRKQVFFALLNYRIIIVFLKNIRILLDTEIEGLEDIRFLQLPQEMLSEENNFENGLTAYEWACKGERDLCQFLDSERNEMLDLSFVHTTLLAMKLFEPNNILVNGEKCFEKCILIFDDYHKLSESQKEYLSEAAYTLKATLGIWFGQRLEGVKNNQLISMDGSLDRDYHPNIVMDNFWVNKKGSFHNMLENIADRRVKESSINDYSKFNECLTDKLEVNKYKKDLAGFCSNTKNGIVDTYAENHKYVDLLKYGTELEEESVYEAAIYYECIRIWENREECGQYALDLGEKIQLEEFKKFFEKNRDAAEYYLCFKCNIPFYYGLNKLQILSSYNIEQFLYFSSDLFDSCRAKLISQNKRSNKKYLLTNEQEENIINAVKKKWDDMDFRYIDIDRIKNFLNNIAAFGEKSRKAERASYAGGAYTGIGIKSDELKSAVENPKFQLVMETLGECFASKYLERREINGGNITVFYLNRWLCVYYKLPLAYGGWCQCNMEKLKTMCSDKEIDENQLVLSIAGE